MAGQTFSGLSQASDTTIQNKPKMTLWVFFPKTWEHESFTCWPAGAMLGLYQCSAYTSLNKPESDMSRKSVGTAPQWSGTDLLEDFGFKSVTLFSVRRKYNWLLLTVGSEVI